MRLFSSADKFLKGEMWLLLLRDCFASDAAHFRVHPYNICGEAMKPGFKESSRASKI